MLADVCLRYLSPGAARAGPAAARSRSLQAAAHPSTPSVSNAARTATAHGRAKDSPSPNCSSGSVGVVHFLGRSLVLDPMGVPRVDLWWGEQLLPSCYQRAVCLAEVPLL